MARNILVVGPSWVGDMVMAQALFKLLKKKEPSCHIDVLASDWTFALLARMPEIRTPISMPIKHGKLQMIARFRIGQQLRNNDYQQAIILPNSFKSALIPFFARIPQRTGYAREARACLLTDARYLNKKTQTLMVEQYLALGLSAQESVKQPYAYPELQAVPVSTEVSQRLQLSQTKKLILAMAPGAAFGSAKRWPEEYYAAVAKHYAQCGYQIWLFGSQADLPVTNAIQAALPHDCINFAGKISLAETVDLLAEVSALLTNDSGLMHVAAALNKPIVAIYGPTSPRFTPPLSAKACIVQKKLSCQPCFARVCPLQHHRCMREILPAEVIQHIAERSLH